MITLPLIACRNSILLCNLMGRKRGRQNGRIIQQKSMKETIAFLTEQFIMFFFFANNQLERANYVFERGVSNYTSLRSNCYFYCCGVDDWELK